MIRRERVRVWSGALAHTALLDNALHSLQKDRSIAPPVLPDPCVSTSGRYSADCTTARAISICHEMLPAQIDTLVPKARTEVRIAVANPLPTSASATACLTLPC